MFFFPRQHIYTLGLSGREEMRESHSLARTNRYVTFALVPPVRIFQTQTGKLAASREFSRGRDRHSDVELVMVALGVTRTLSGSSSPSRYSFSSTIVQDEAMSWNGSGTRVRSDKRRTGEMRRMVGLGSEKKLVALALIGWLCGAVGSESWP